MVTITAIVFQAKVLDSDEFMALYIVAEHIAFWAAHDRLAIGSTKGPFTSLFLLSGQMLVVEGNCEDTLRRINHYVADGRKR